MIKLWSELPRARSRELLADFTTLIWVVFWSVVVWRLFVFLSSFAQAGRSVQAGGQSMVQGGRDLGESLAGLPLVGAQARDIARDAFAGAGTPLVSFGTELERFIFVIAFALAALLAIVTLQPWLSRYLPWRLTRVRRVRAAHQAIRTGSELSDPDTRRVLAMRAVSRLDYADLLEYTSDPLGDWAAGRHDALARAELASQGLDG
jgi:hypothetical protein